MTHHFQTGRAPPSIMLDIDLLSLSLKYFFTTNVCIALRDPDGFTLPHNLIRETILWEMPVLFDYYSLVSWRFPPVSSHAEHS